MYVCPVYVNSSRGPTFVTDADIRMESDESDPHKWVLSGVAMMMSPE